MSIKTFHILFIVFSFILSLGVGYWGINESPVIGFLSFIGSAILIYYGFYVFKKFRAI